MVRNIIAGLLLSAMVLTGIDSTARASSPVAETCVAPEMSANQMEGTTAAVEVDDAASAPMANPETAANVIAGIENFVACRNAGNYAAYAALLTPNRVFAESGTDNPMDVVAGLEAFNLPITILSLGDVRVQPDGRLSAEFVHLFGEHLFYRSRIYVIEEDGFVKFDEEQFLPEEPEGNQQAVDVELADFAFKLERGVVDNAQFVILHGHNETAMPHEIIVVRLPDEVTAEQALSGEVDESTIEFIGQTIVAPGESDDLVLVNLAPGTYSLLCLLVDPDGVPHAAKGMAAELFVEGVGMPTITSG